MKYTNTILRTTALVIVLMPCFAVGATKLQLRATLGKGIQEQIKMKSSPDFQAWFDKMMSAIKDLYAYEPVTSVQYLNRLQGIIGDSGRVDELTESQLIDLGFADPFVPEDEIFRDPTGPDAPIITVEISRDCKPFVEKLADEIEKDPRQANERFISEEILRSKDRPDCLIEAFSRALNGLKEFMIGAPKAALPGIIPTYQKAPLAERLRTEHGALAQTRNQLDFIGRHIKNIKDLLQNSQTSITARATIKPLYKSVLRILNDEIFTYGTLALEDAQSQIKKNENMRFIMHNMWTAGVASARGSKTYDESIYQKFVQAANAWAKEFATQKESLRIQFKTWFGNVETMPLENLMGSSQFILFEKSEVMRANFAFNALYRTPSLSTLIPSWQEDAKKAELTQQANTSAFDIQELERILQRRLNALEASSQQRAQINEKINRIKTMYQKTLEELMDERALEQKDKKESSESMEEARQRGQQAAINALQAEQQN